MKGIIFREFLESIELNYSLSVLDTVISKANLPSGAAYTTVGTYSFSEMLLLLNSLSSTTGKSIDDLLLSFGHHFFGVVKRDYSSLLKSYKNALDMISSVESHIHIEVRKIYPDAELPHFKILESSDNRLTMLYSSSRAMHYFGLG
ncbi:heme NO-binding domain-containing protein [Polaribacter tangerinus]|uniref:heme NO-binding domain-containing protein n=1 Tax=Polaribacter tangerinus TaxID=1920034 RepID=UPI00293718B0|nr:heme NO-binding domain-containing protein [Polaribacter tangerinus]